MIEEEDLDLCACEHPRMDHEDGVKDCYWQYCFCARFQGSDEDDD